MYERNVFTIITNQFNSICCLSDCTGSVASASDGISDCSGIFTSGSDCAVKTVGCA